MRTAVVHSKPARAIAIVGRRTGKAPRLLHVAAAGRPNGQLAWRATQELLERMPQRRSAVSAVLDPADYQLLQVDELSLPPAELRAALRWKIRDLVAFPIEHAEIDVFTLPSVRGSPRRLQVVAAPNGVIDELEAIVRGARRRLDVIDIPELALRNLMVLMPQDSSGCALLLLGRRSIHILVTCQGVLYIARRIDWTVGAKVEQLALELQRSMQYYESQFDRAPIGEVLVAPNCLRARELAPVLSQATGLTCTPLALEEFLPCEPGIAPLDEPEVIVAIGAALRPTTAGQAS
ncbi:MAG: hypothetical protein NZM12_02320 [Steroidobacteraceae bacterium]|nr:hypothetical protein [Steroidobacteraceae bacterium]MDW8259802.1 hypothetical protein [Gammaproteobacteria bacterium]